MSTSLQTSLEESMDNHIIPNCVSISDFSDEILLNVLRFVPSHDLVLNVRRVCQRLHTLTHDKTLVSHTSLRTEYTASDDSVKQLLKELANDTLSLNMSGCYWLAGSTVDHVTRCKGVVRLDLSGCRLTSARLSRVLSSLRLLRALAVDVVPGFDPQLLSTESKATLARLEELTHTLHTPSYGLVPCCSALQRLVLYLEVGDGSRDGTASCVALMVGQSSVPHYQALRWFSARLAPGVVNRTLLALYLAVFSIRVPQQLAGLVLSVPGPATQCPAAVAMLMDSMGLSGANGGGAISALQLPRAWLDGLALGRVLSHGCPAYLNFSRCSSPGLRPLQTLLTCSDLSPLRSLNLRGCGRGMMGGGRGEEEELDVEGVASLTDSCPRLAHLNLSATHYHHEDTHTHLCVLLGRLASLRSLALPVCALAQGRAPAADTQGSSLTGEGSSPRLLLGLKKSRRVGLQTFQPRAEVPHRGQDITYRGQEVTEVTDRGQEVTELTARDQEVRENRDGSCLWPLLQGCPHLAELEVIGAGFSSAMPRNEPAIRKDPVSCPWSCLVGDAEIAALGGLRFLRRLTLASLPGVLTGAGLVEMTRHCQDMQALSLANLGSLKTMNYTPALLEALTHCTQLRELRLEQPYLNANAAFFDALSHCRLLRRVCLVSRGGTFSPVAVATFMQHCRDVIMCHMFMGGTLVACRTVQKTLLDSLSAERPALSVVCYPLLHEDLGHVIREMPLTHLDDITLFKSRVADEPHTHTHHLPGV